MSDLRPEKLEQVIRAAPSIIKEPLDHQDPDSYAAAIGMKKIFEFFNKSVELYAAGQPGRKQNEVILNHFKLSFAPMDLFVAGRRDNDFIALVDAHSLQNPRYGVEIEGRPNIIIDHHKKNGHRAELVEDENSYFLLEEVASASTLVAKLLFSLKVPLTKPDNVATLLMIGIKNDSKETNSLDMTVLDYQILAALSEYSNQEDINKISLSKLNRTFWEELHTGTTPETNLRFGVTTAIMYLENIPPDQWHYLEIMAERLLETDGIDTAYAWTIWEGWLILKIRNITSGRTINKKIINLFGEDCGGSKNNISGGVNYKLGTHGKTKDRESLVRVWKSLLEDELLE